MGTKPSLTTEKTPQHQRLYYGQGQPYVYTQGWPTYQVPGSASFPARGTTSYIPSAAPCYVTASYEQPVLGPGCGSPYANMFQPPTSIPAPYWGQPYIRQNPVVYRGYYPAIPTGRSPVAGTSGFQRTQVGGRVKHDTVLGTNVQTAEDFNEEVTVSAILMLT